ncbi:hypothetical protein OESDEN_02037 [Oesophagostomum dentatum]|uniref:7TM GPCR serpentine receptor class x (Srx) domain-containing protein n=1 Tax=Oesophagostomum dentatum TaxID=61180 RepID=A0A0B1TL29_OESDE|nr:hypothetical protein OESDEN_02037 [Oesophagostomum dentatum]
MREGWIAATVIFMISFTGVVCNLIVAIFARTLKSLKNPFGRLSASQATGEAMLCATFAFYYAPMPLICIVTKEKH